MGHRAESAESGKTAREGHVNLRALIFVLLAALWPTGRSLAQTVLPTPGPELVGGVGMLNALESGKQPFAFVDYRFAPVGSWGLRPWVGATVADRGTWFASAGLVYTLPLDSAWRLSGGLAPSYYEAGQGQKLGLDLEFYSYVEAGYVFHRGDALNLRFAHLSNAGLANSNPGTALLMLAYSVPWP
jgi:hypothetical protein